MAQIRRAIISVTDKTGVEAFARRLSELGVAIVASGGTASLLRAAGVEVTEVSQVTGAAEILGGRVKTLHPTIFAGILARPTPEHEGQLASRGVEPIDLVIVNLYPFEEHFGQVEFAKAVELIDIGGPSLVRAAAKNHERTTVVVSPKDYEMVLAEMEAHQGGVSEATRRRLAARAFAHTAHYDGVIAGYFREALGVEEEADPFPELLSLPLRKTQALRYGENPHQRGAIYAAAVPLNLPPPASDGAIATPSGFEFEQLAGQQLSYNNILDLDGAWRLVVELPATSVAVIKHTNPCGAAFREGGDPALVFELAQQTDPVSAFGGIVACNVSVTAAMAEKLREMFLEVVVAPEFDSAAVDVLRKKRKLRLLKARVANRRHRSSFEIRLAAGAVLLQETDKAPVPMAEAKVVSKRQPTAAELADLDFAWRVCKHVKSNAIVFAKQGQLVGVGAGQMSRVDSVNLAVAKSNLELSGSVVASDAFFPFADGLEAAAEAGATAVVQPGGSIRDEEVIAAADRLSVALLFTGRRHFRH